MTFLHELGHVLDNLHTHQDGFLGFYSEACGDTLEDDKDWSKDRMSRENFGADYAELTPLQQARVDATYHNVMSYHTPRYALTPCQMGQQSQTAWSDRDWLLSVDPLYVNPWNPGSSPVGSWKEAYPSLDAAQAGGSLDGKVVVLVGGHAASGPIDAVDALVVALPANAPLEVHRDQGHWKLPSHLDRDSTSPAVRRAVEASRRADARGDAEAALEALARAARAAAGEERVALEREIGKRLRHLGRGAEAAAHYERAAEETRQDALRGHARREAERASRPRGAGRRGPGVR